MTRSDRSTSNPTPGTSGPSVTSKEPDDQVRGAAVGPPTGAPTGWCITSFAAYDLFTIGLYGHIKVKKAGPSSWLSALRAIAPSARGPHRHRARQLQPHMSTKTDARVSEWARANNVGLAYTPHHASWLNEVQFTALLPLLSRRHGPREPRGPAFLIRHYIA